jgi:hypothetical protein
MIFHTSADPLYYENFYKFYNESIKLFYPDSKLSFHFVGHDSNIIKSPIDIFSQKKISKKEIEIMYNTSERDTLGYYAISRWLSIPDIGDHVVVSDVDIVAIKSIPTNYILDIFKDYEAINITRTKKNGTEGGMAMMILRKDIISSINQKANEVLNNPTLAWDSDVQVRTFIYENFKVKEIPEMHVMGKNSNFDNFDNTERSFVIYKGDRLRKIEILNKVLGKLKQ